jgi:hypothetical protein
VHEIWLRSLYRAFEFETGIDKLVIGQLSMRNFLYLTHEGTSGSTFASYVVGNDPRDRCTGAYELRCCWQFSARTRR